MSGSAKLLELHRTESPTEGCHSCAGRALELEALLRRVVREELQSMAAHRAPPALEPSQAAVVRLLGNVFGHASFTTRELMALLGVPVGDRPQLLAELRTLAGKDMRANKVGLALRRIADAGGRSGALRLVLAKKDSGARVFCVEGA